MRLHTLPVSLAGVFTGGACALTLGTFRWLPFIICLIFSALAQISSNFANEYFDYKNGLDNKGREGFRRGVTEGDITPTAMRNATFGVLALACLIGLSLTYWGGLWLIAVGFVIAIFAMAYSAGPWPLSHHGLGEVAVIIFFGIVPVSFTAYLSAGSWDGYTLLTLPLSLAIGLMGANVLIVNNYRDVEDDRRAGKRTSAVILGAGTMRGIYLVNGFVAALLIAFAGIVTGNLWWDAAALIYANLHFLLWQNIARSTGKELNPLLGKTAMLMFVLALFITVSALPSLKI